MTKYNLNELHKRAREAMASNNVFAVKDYFENKYDFTPNYDGTKNGMKKYFRELFDAYSFASPRLLDYIHPDVIKHIRSTIDPVEKDGEHYKKDPSSMNMSITKLVDDKGIQIVLDITEGMVNELNDEYLLGFNKEEILFIMGIVVESDRKWLWEIGIGVRILQPFLMEAVVLKNIRNAITKGNLPLTARYASISEDVFMGVDIAIEYDNPNLPLSPLYVQVKPKHQAQWAYKNKNALLHANDFPGENLKEDNYWKRKIAKTLSEQRQRKDTVLWIGYTFGNKDAKDPRVLWANDKEFTFPAVKENEEKYTVGYNIDNQSQSYLGNMIEDAFRYEIGFDFITGEYDRAYDKKKILTDNFENAQMSDKSDLQLSVIYGEKRIANYKNKRAVQKKIIIAEKAPEIVIPINADTVVIDPLDILYAIDYGINNDDVLVKERKIAQKPVLYDEHYADMPIQRF